MSSRKRRRHPLFFLPPRLLRPRRAGPPFADSSTATRLPRAATLPGSGPAGFHAWRFAGTLPVAGIRPLARILWRMRVAPAVQCRAIRSPPRSRRSLTMPPRPKCCQMSAFSVAVRPMPRRVWHTGCLTEKATVDRKELP